MGETGYSHGFRWRKEAIERLKELKIGGYTVRQIAEKMSLESGLKVTQDGVNKAAQRYLGPIEEYLLEEDIGIGLYESDTLDMDNYAIWCDQHSPFHSEMWINRGLHIANLFGIKKLINIGDAFDCDFARKWITGGRKNVDEEIFHSDPVVKAFDYFDEVYLVKGNHESRIERMTDNLLKSKHLMGIFGIEIAKKKFKLSNYDKVFIGPGGKEGWLLVHPSSYSQIKGSVARRLAEKFHRNVINTHGHFVNFEYDRSGNFQVYDLGGMFDVKKVAYINLRTTTHPTWNNGFGILRNEKFWHFTNATDWDYWMAQ